MQNIKNRIIADYFSKNRLCEYEALLCFAIKLGYNIISVINYFDLVKSGVTIEKTIINRHDIDTAPHVAKEFFAIEKKLGVHASYYFRMSTLDFTLMKEIERYGSEASYHFEELADYCKKNKIKSNVSNFEHISNIKKEFFYNYDYLKGKVDLPMRSVASHGDFINRYLEITNHTILTQDLRDQCGIDVEAYDAILKASSISISDTSLPVYWKYNSPLEIMRKGKNVIYLLTHPKHWRCTPWENTKENMKRLFEGVRYFYT